MLKPTVVAMALGAGRSRRPRAAPRRTFASHQPRAHQLRAARSGGGRPSHDDLRPRRNAWFTAQQAGAVGRLEVANGRFRIWRTGAGTRPYGIVADGGGRIWFDLFGTNELGAIDPTSLEPKRYPLPEGARPRRIGVTSDGAVWYSDYARGYLGRLDPATGAVREFALPGGGRSLPYAMAVDDRDRVWVAESGMQPNRLVAFDPRRSVFTDTVDTEGGAAPNTIRHMVYHAPTREIWFATDRNTVGRLRVP